LGIVWVRRERFCERKIPPNYLSGMSSKVSTCGTFDDSAQGHDSPGKKGASCAASLAGSAAAASCGQFSEDSGWEDRFFAVDVAKGGEVYGKEQGYEQGFGEEEEKQQQRAAAVEDYGYGIDELRPLCRRPETLFLVWGCLLLLAAAGLNVWVGLSGQRRQAQLAGTSSIGPPPPPPPLPSQVPLVTYAPLAGTRRCFLLC
jgi:hypothetical protein